MIESIYCNGQKMTPKNCLKGNYPVHKYYLDPNLPYDRTIVGKFGQLLFFELPLEAIRVQYQLFEIAEDLNIEMAYSDSMPHLWGTLEFNGPTYASGRIKSFSFSFVPSINWRWKATLLEGKRYIFLRIYFPVEYLYLLDNAEMELKRDWDVVIDGSCTEQLKVAGMQVIDEVEKIIHNKLSWPDLVDNYVESVSQALILRLLHSEKASQSVFVLRLGSKIYS